MYKKVYVEITNICNMNCSFCHGHKRQPRQMSAEEFGIILDKLTEQTKYIYYHLMGEPLTHPQLPLFLKMAGQHGYKSIITTNGTLLNKCGDSLIAAKVHKINISLHSFENGTDETHCRYISDVAEFSKKAAAAGVIVVFRLWNKGCDSGKNAVTLELLKEKLGGEWQENARGVKLSENIYLEWGERFFWPDSNAPIQGDKFFCYGLKDQFGILADGTVVPCCLDSDGVINLGNIFSGDIKEILSCQRAQAIVQGFRNNKAAEELCKRCGYAQKFV